MDDTYQVYVNRVARTTLPEAYRSQVQHIQASPKFQHGADGSTQPAPFPGYSVITPPPPDDDSNRAFYQWLTGHQRQLVEEVGSGIIVPVPPESFHMTLADLIWDSAYRHALETPDFERQLRDQIAYSFRQCQAEAQREGPIWWQVLGLIVMTRAIGICLAPKDDDSYQRIVALRRAIYQNSSLMALGVEQQYHFTAHITLGYFGPASAAVDRDRLSQQFNSFNQQGLELSPPPLLVERAELRKFDDMTRYYRASDWPVFQF